MSLIAVRATGVYTYVRVQNKYKRLFTLEKGRCCINVIVAQINMHFLMVTLYMPIVRNVIAF